MALSIFEQEQIAHRELERRMDAIVRARAERYAEEERKRGSYPIYTDKSYEPKLVGENIDWDSIDEELLSKLVWKQNKRRTKR